jgi:hypothetical protein
MREVSWLPPSVLSRVRRRVEKAGRSIYGAAGGGWRLRSVLISLNWRISKVLAEPENIERLLSGCHPALSSRRPVFKLPGPGHGAAGSVQQVKGPCGD